MITDALVFFKESLNNSLVTLSKEREQELIKLIIDECKARLQKEDYYHENNQEVARSIVRKLLPF